MDSGGAVGPACQELQLILLIDWSLSVEKHLYMRELMTLVFVRKSNTKLAELSKKQFCRIIGNYGKAIQTARHGQHLVNSPMLRTERSEELS